MTRCWANCETDLDKENMASVNWLITHFDLECHLGILIFLQNRQCGYRFHLQDCWHLSAAKLGTSFMWHQYCNPTKDLVRSSRGMQCKGLKPTQLELVCIIASCSMMLGCSFLDKQKILFIIVSIPVLFIMHRVMLLY